ncbi:ABC transporter substrate-binding protein [Geodermatophilus obscurus]|uniref:ABC-type branched-chain amino acid transport systems periplasmic component-like protein n=1 Tax=Geodermatophilus obscurus (strain ATCC 25078 / DSM 43160 / JCM 3152 / CCUG 61914 / KCC A-0152 / KCTC 9177 / NBRC 13315 / NRRL B-3577 / G-20) TaxID=526225 RepID=D2S9L2_GEOOG|nr:ABC transporter substrate-binding protein [Geodermatophilus obscurus]ADB75812.1 ABC-type branched-chain amino acid transport systems periplasmic component-like protein [Geodermatophilus obscurus DSM 43160]
MRTGILARNAAVAAAALLVLTACGGGGEDTGGGGDAAGETGGGERQVNVYGTDGNMGNALGESFTAPGSLAGMKGTTPLTDLGSEFTDRLREIDPNLQDYNYAGETYDAVIVTALAAQAAGTNDANVFKAFVNGMTVGGEACTDFAACLEIINNGGNVDYNGISGPLSFTDAGEPAEASFGILQFGEDNQLDEDATDFVLAGDSANATSDEGPAYAAPGATSEPLVIGTLLPLTGNLAFLGPPEVAGARLAVNDINAAGGVLGQPVQLIEGDSGDASTDTATQTVDRLLQGGVNAIIGAASSGVSLTVIDRITGSGVVQFSPANTSDQFTDYNDNGLYFRTAPPDVLQARALSDLIINDGNNTVGIMALNDPYGTGLMENTRENLIAAGLAEDSIQTLTYDPQAANYDAEIQQMVDFAPDAVVVIGFEESARIIESLNSQGIGPQR